MSTPWLVLAAMLAVSVTLTAPAALAQEVTREQAVAMARSKTGGGTVLGIRTRRSNGSSVHLVRILNPQGQVVTIKIRGKR